MGGPRSRSHSVLDDIDVPEALCVLYAIVPLSTISTLPRNTWRGKGPKGGNTLRRSAWAPPHQNWAPEPTSTREPCALDAEEGAARDPSKGFVTNEWETTNARVAKGGANTARDVGAEEGDLIRDARIELKARS